jgi:hypothetical protein
VIVPPKKNYIPQFLKQRDINSYYDLLYFMKSHLEDVDHLIGGLPGLPRQL